MQKSILILISPDLPLTSPSNRSALVLKLDGYFTMVINAGRDNCILYKILYKFLFEGSQTPPYIREVGLERSYGVLNFGAGLRAEVVGSVRGEESGVVSEE